MARMRFTERTNSIARYSVEMRSRVKSGMEKLIQMSAPPGVRRRAARCTGCGRSCYGCCEPQLNPLVGLTGPFVVSGLTRPQL